MVFRNLKVVNFQMAIFYGHIYIECGRLSLMDKITQNTKWGQV